MTNSLTRLDEIMFMLFDEMMQQTIMVICLIIEHLNKGRRKRQHGSRYSMIERIPYQVQEMERLVGNYDTDCFDNIRMDQNTFGRICLLLNNLGGLTRGKFVSIEEQVAIFLSILAHHKKTRVVKYRFRRSRQTISHYVHVVLTAVLQLHTVLMVKPIPVPIDCTDPRWKWFKVLSKFYLFLYDLIF